MTIDNNYMYACAYKVDEFVGQSFMVQLLRIFISQLTDMDCKDNQSYMCQKVKLQKQNFSDHI